MRVGKVAGDARIFLKYPAVFSLYALEESYVPFANQIGRRIDEARRDFGLPLIGRSGL